MKSEELNRELTLLYDGYNEVVSNNPSNKESLLKTIANNIDNTVEELFKKGKQEDYYWENCTFFTYQNKYQERLEQYLHSNDNEEYNELDFINSERLAIEYSGQLHYLTFLNGEILEALNKSRTKKLLMLHEKEEAILHNTDILLDLSEDNAAIKVIYLYRLGIIDFLRKQVPFNTSTKKLAEALSGVTGSNPGTLQSYLNAIVSKGVDKSKSPLTNTENDNRVHKRLMELGFDPK